MGVVVRRYIDILTIIGERSEPPLSVELSEFSLYTVESRFFESPRETEIASKNREFEKSKVVSNHA